MNMADKRNRIEIYDTTLRDGSQAEGVSLSLQDKLLVAEALRDFGGHVGYGVRPSERGKGYATRMLVMALDKARQLGLKRVLITCDKDNLASARVIQKNGGVLGSESYSPQGGRVTQRYWIDL